MEIVVRNIGHKGRVFYYEPSTVVIRGELVDNPTWIGVDCITIQGPNHLHIIKRQNIVGDPPQLAIPTTTQTFRIRGSKGDEYIVMKQKNYWTCNCIGFSFHNDCRHIREAKSKFNLT